jgi:hypothetical protein
MKIKRVAIKITGLITGIQTGYLLSMRLQDVYRVVIIWGPLGCDTGGHNPEDLNLNVSGLLTVTL